MVQDFLYSCNTHDYYGWQLFTALKGNTAMADNSAAVTGSTAMTDNSAAVADNTAMADNSAA